jgi:hypothetical protein
VVFVSFVSLKAVSTGFQYAAAQASVTIDGWIFCNELGERKQFRAETQARAIRRRRPAVDHEANPAEPVGIEPDQPVRINRRSKEMEKPNHNTFRPASPFLCFSAYTVPSVFSVPPTR